MTEDEKALICQPHFDGKAETWGKGTQLKKCRRRGATAQCRLIKFCHTYDYYEANNRLWLNLRHRPKELTG